MDGKGTYLVAEAMYARRAIRQNVGRLHRETRFIYVHAATSDQSNVGDARSTKKRVINMILIKLWLMNSITRMVDMDM